MCNGKHAVGNFLNISLASQGTSQSQFKFMGSLHTEALSGEAHQGIPAATQVQFQEQPGAPFALNKVTKCLSLPLLLARSLCFI